MKLVKIHRLLRFKQSNWLRVFRDFNTEKRKCSKDLLVKSIENIRKRINVKLINDKKTYLKCVNKPIFISSKIVDKNFVAVHCSKKVLTLKKKNLCWIFYS